MIGYHGTNRFPPDFKNTASGGRCDAHTPHLKQAFQWSKVRALHPHVSPFFPLKLRGLLLRTPKNRPV